MASQAPITCVNGEVKVEDILVAINLLMERNDDLEDCCEELRVGDIIRIRRVDNIMYMTNDGSTP